MSNDMSAYLKAMAQVRNVQIDPTTGKTLAAKNESVLAAIDKVAPLKGPLKDALNIPLAKESAKQMTSIQDAYMKNFMNQDPEEVKKHKMIAEEIQKPKFIKVGQRPDEANFMKQLAAKCAKSNKY